MMPFLILSRRTKFSLGKKSCMSGQPSDTEQPSVQHIFADGKPQIHNALSSGWYHTTSRTIESVTMPPNQTIIESFELVGGRDAIMKGRICYVVPFNAVAGDFFFSGIIILTQCLLQVQITHIILSM